MLNQYKYEVGDILEFLISPSSPNRSLKEAYNKGNLRLIREISGEIYTIKYLNTKFKDFDSIRTTKDFVENPKHYKKISNVNTKTLKLLYG